MITIKKQGDLLKEDVQAYVNTVNCVGIMGKGIALQFKMKYPENYKLYKKACNKNKVQIGKMFITEINDLFDTKYIINFPTKKHWKGKSKLEYIEKGLDDLAKQVRKLNIKSIVIPPLGCGFGGLHWKEVRPLIEQKLSSIEDVKIILYAPSKAPKPEEMEVHTTKPKMTIGRAALIGLLKNYAEVGYEITMLEIQKLMYFLQEAGEPLRLKYRKAKYGPYADNLHHVLQAMEKHYIEGYGDRSSSVQIHLLKDGIPLAEKVIQKHPETAKRFKKVVQLIEGFETPYGLELLATVHWTMTRENKTQLSKIVEYVRGWSSRKKELFSEEHIKIAKERLEKTNFVH